MIDEADRRELWAVAVGSIRYGLGHHRPLPLHREHYSETLRSQGAAFVTLERAGELRGCIGTLEPHRSLLEDVAENAFNAAFRDPRFPPLMATELTGLTLHISVLGTPLPMQFISEADLLRQLRPGIDGVIFQFDHYRATFLPSVWESLPDPRQFLTHLKFKAGLPGDFWAEQIKVSRYTTESFGGVVT